MRNGKSVSIKDGSIELSYEYFIIDEIPLDGYCVASNNHIIVSINTLLDKDLINEGMIRDLIRKIQNLRKDSNFNVEDRIDISLISDEKLYNAIKINKEYLLNEVLGTSLIFHKCEDKFVK